MRCRSMTGGWGGGCQSLSECFDFNSHNFNNNEFFGSHLFNEQQPPKELATYIYGVEESDFCLNLI